MSDQSQCHTCLLPFIPETPTQLFCNESCYPDYYALIMTTTRACKTCGILFRPRSRTQNHCHHTCQPVAAWAGIPPDADMTTQSIGTMGEMFVCADLLRRGYDVFRSVSPSCYCDILAHKNGIVLHIESRTARYKRTGLEFATRSRTGVTCLAVWERETDVIHYFHPNSHKKMAL